MKLSPTKSNKSKYIEWNDHISQFIKIKIHRPELLKDLIQKQTEYSLQKQHEKIIFYEKNKLQKINLNLDKQIDILDQKLAFKQELLEQLLALNAENNKILKEIQTIQIQSLMKKNTNNSPFLDGQSQGLNQNQIFSQQQLKAKRQQYKKIKARLYKSISKLVEEKICLKQEINLIKQNIQTLKNESVLNSQSYEMTTVKQMLKQLEEKSKELKQKFKLRQKDEEGMKNVKTKQRQAIEASKARISLFVKQAKELLYGDKPKNSKKVSKFMEKYQIGDLDNILSRFASIQGQKKHEYSRSLKYQTSLKQFSEKIGKLEDFKKQIIKNYHKSSDIQELDGFQNFTNEAVYSYEQYLENLKKTDKKLKDDIQVLTKSLQKKQKELQLAKKQK